MEEKTFNAVFNWIEKFHRKQGLLDPQVRAEWHREFIADHDEVFCEAGQKATRNLAPGLFPTIERMKKFVTEAREQLWQTVKNKEPKKPLSEPPKDFRNVEHGRQALKLILKISEQGYTDDILAELEEMGQKHPRWALDWRGEKNRLEQMRAEIARREGEGHGRI